METVNLNMDTGRIHLQFAETVDVSSIVVEKISIRTEDDANFVVLTAASSSVVTTANGLTVLIQVCGPCSPPPHASIFRMPRFYC